jgi:CHAD domain-containing protein
MSYQFTNREPVPLAVRRIVREEVAFAADNLKVNRAAKRDEAIHEIRKAVKRVRALLKLMRPVFGDGYDLEMAAWRNLGQILSAVRDAEAMLQALEELRPACPEKLYALLRRRLMEKKRETLRHINPVIAKLAAGLRKSTTRLKFWPMEDEGFRTIEPGWKRTYRMGARAMQEAEKEPSPENLHNLRKRTKEHYFQLRLLEGLWDRKLRRHKAKAQRLEEMLGAHRNLVVLKATILEEAAGNVAGFLAVLDKKEKDLAAKVLKLGVRVYSERASRMMRRVKQRWEHWTDL